MDHEKWLEQHDQMMADFDVKMAEGAARHDREMAQIRESQLRIHETQLKTDRRLDRAVQLGVKEARNQRKRHQELEALLKAFLERGGNGKH